MRIAISRRRALAAGVAIGAAALSRPGLAADTRFFRRPGVLLGLQTFSLGNAFDRDPAASLRAIAEVGFKAVELPWLRTNAKELRDLLDQNELKCPSVMVRERNPLVQKPDLYLSTDLDRIAENLNIVEADTAIFSTMPIPERFQRSAEEAPLAFMARVERETKPDDWLRYADYLNQKGGALARHGLRVGVHNHSGEFEAKASGLPIELVMAHTDPRLVTFELDVGWAAATGADVAGFLRRYGGRISQMHLKDFRQSSAPAAIKGVEFTEVGAGSIEWRSVLAAAYEAGVRRFFVEHEGGASLRTIESVRRSFDHLRHVE